MTYEQWVQTRLTAQGFVVPTDGDWGRVSIGALNDFQKRIGLTVSGVTERANTSIHRQFLSARSDALIQA